MLANERGAALMVTLGIVAILLAIALQLAQFTGNAAVQTMVKNDQFAAAEMAMSGIHLAMLILAQDAQDNNTDSLQETWADQAGLQKAVKDLGFESGTLDLVISDELGKIQLNALLKQFPGNEINRDQQALLERFFHLTAASRKTNGSGNPVEIINAMIDWLDSKDNDAVTGITGAESDYYRNLDPPRRCADGPFMHVEELFNVKGVAKESLSDEEAKPLEFKEVFTVYGIHDRKNEKRYVYPGKININTAPLPIIEALLPEGKEHLAEDLAAYRVETSNQDGHYTHLLEQGWYGNVIEFTEKEKAEFSRKINYSSHIFRAESKAARNTAQVRLSAIIKREQQKETGKWASRVIQLEKI